MKIVFLDRDGVINKYPGDTKYVTSLNEFELLPGALEAIKKLTKDEYKIFVISNQAGISKGIYSQEELDKITNSMIKKIESKSGSVQEVMYCIHQDEDNCSCRKPKTGSIKKAIESLGLKSFDFSRSFFVGDTIRDIKTGKSAGCKTILVFSGKEKKENEKNWEVKPDYQVENLLEAANLILNENPHNLCHSRSGPPQGSRGDI